MSYLGGRTIYIDSDGNEHFDYERDYEPKSATNYDRVISKSPEELSEFCIWMCPPGYNENFACEVEKERCYNCWLDWLKQEAAE